MRRRQEDVEMAARRQMRPKISAVWGNGPGGADYLHVPKVPMYGVALVEEEKAKGTINIRFR